MLELQILFYATFITFYLSDLFVMHLLSCIQFDSYYKLVYFLVCHISYAIKVKNTRPGGCGGGGQRDIWMPN